MNHLSNLFRHALWLSLAVFVLAPPAAGAGVSTSRLPEGARLPQVKVDEQGIAHLIYLRGDRNGNLYYVRKAPDEQQFDYSREMRVNSQRGSVYAPSPLHTPRLALGGQGRVHVAWMGGGSAINAQGQILVASVQGAGWWNRGASLVWQVYSSTGRPLGPVAGVPDGIAANNFAAAYAGPDGSFVILY